MNNWTKSARIAFIGIWGVLLLSLGALVANSSPTSAAPPAQGSPPGSSLWRDVSETAVRGQGTRWIIPVKYRLLAADIVALDNLLGQAPLENSLSTQSVEVLLTLPLPDGSFGRFRLEEAPMMEPALAAKFPEIKTYRGWGLDDPTATAYLDRTPAGFHGMILSSSDTVYIDPYQQGDITHYLSYFKQDYGNIWGKSFQEEGFEPAESPRSQNVSSAANSGPTLHTYRLAMAATAEYTQFHGTVASALAAINTTMNRVNGIYQREVSIRMILIANTDQLIYTDGVTDPYTNDDGGAMLDENQGNVDAVIGSANYDIGHVFSTGGGGVASLESPCWNLAKAHGVTGSPAPVGDPFDVDFVAHEMGHQFGGNHTFNSGNAGSCAGGNRNGPTAYEPGSGTTIMAYAGICSPQDLQPNSDDNFHGISFDEITAYVTNPTPGFGGSCGAHTATGNAAPTVNAGLNTTIPISTPFTLTGSATDPNGDTLTYQWEEFDLGNAWTINAVLPNNDSSGARPIFRSYKPVSSPARIFPAPANILNGSLFNIGEALPSINRTMTFRLTARDNKGGVNNDAMNVSVTNTSGPFRVTAPLTGTTWTSATLQTVSWNVANTTAAPVSCTNVNILFSSDDGSNFGNTLLANTPNDGTETITAPILGTSNGRVKVTCSGNIFFHISGRITLIGNTPINTYLPFILRNN